MPLVRTVYSALAGGEPLEKHLLGCGFTCLSEQKPEKEQERGRRAEKRAQREGRQCIATIAIKLKWNQVKSLHELDKLR